MRVGHHPQDDLTKIWLQVREKTLARIRIRAMLCCQNAGNCCLNVAISVFSPQNLVNLGHFSPKITFEEFTMQKKKKEEEEEEEKKKTSVNSPKKKEKKKLLLAIETLQNHFIFEFLVFKISFWRRFT
jgi:hypothetical protein